MGAAYHFATVTAIMISDHKPLRQSLTSFLGSLGTQLRAALSTGLGGDDSDRRTESLVDPEFEAWLHGDPAVRKNPASRYGDRTPGYITGNGLGSMEIGAADD